jgi:hypothetical protein
VNDLHSLEPNKIVEYIRYSIELLDEPIGRILFLGITIVFYHQTINSISYNPIEYMEGVISIIPFGIGYSIIYILFYSIGFP